MGEVSADVSQIDEKKVSDCKVLAEKVKVNRKYSENYKKNDAVVKRFSSIPGLVID